MTDHIVGMAGQVAAAVPLVIITALISHTISLHEAGRFTVVVGLSAFVFAPARWGMRPSIVIDNLKAFSPSEYAWASALTITGAALTSFILAVILQVPPLLTLAVLLFRCCETVIDLDLAFTQVWHPNAKALRRFTTLHTLKLIAAVIATALSFWIRGGSAPILVVCAALVALGIAVAALRASLSGRTGRPFTWRRLWPLFGHSKWYASANIASAGISSAPRIILPALYGGDTLGVVGVSLSMGTFFGMAFYTTILRFLPTFSKAQNKFRAVEHFMIETAAVVAASVLVSWTVLPPLTALIFGFHDAAFLDLSRHVLVANVLFSAGMNLTNLYKVTPRPWGETICYMVPFPVVGALLILLPTLRNMPTALVAAGISMALAAIPAVILLSHRHRTAGDTTNG